MLMKSIVYGGEDVAVGCDGNCKKAWGINSRPKVQLSEDENDWEYLSDNDLRDAPIDPGTYEGGVGKPREEGERLNKWCVRECERSVMTMYQGELVELPDFGVRRRNRRG